MTFNQILLIFKAHFRTILTTLLIVLIGAITTAVVLPKSYKAYAKLIIDVRSPDSIFGNAGLPLTSPAYMNTQAEIATSRRVIEQAVDNLKLSENEQLKENWESRGNPKPDFKEWLIEFVQDNVKVSPGKESNTLVVVASSDSPSLSAQIANGVSKAYINTSVELNVEPAKVYAQFFDKQQREAREELIAAQTRLSNFQRDQGIVIASDDQIDVENARLNELSSALTQIEAESAAQYSRAASSGNAGLLQDPLSNIVLNNLRTQLQEKQSRLAEASARIGVNHPEYRRLKAEVDALQASVSKEIERSNATLGANARASAGREATIRKALEEQRNKILKLKENIDSAMTLKRDLDAAQKQFEMVSTRSSMSDISSRQATADAFLVSEASIPSEVSSPKIGVIVISAMLFGLLLGMAVACITEYLDHRVRSKYDLAALGMPTLALIPANKRLYRQIGN